MSNDNPLNDIMWASFIQFAMGQESFRAQFEADTGMRFLSDPKSPIDAMIDEASGATGKIVRAFMEWVTREHWGVEYAPVAFQKELEAGKAGT